ncbi:MAG TPA: lysylphosphatidylglycerol synthase domain-containing protein, partial [Thermomicrobiales bacterium]|nr:lysylphosphatidylglycerol synthase domain-containing protein [Thermomicrobiales bacterium]
MRTALRISHRPEHPPAAVVEEREKDRNPLRRALVPAVLIGIGFVTALALLGDARDLAGALRRFNWWLIVPILALTVWNYCWRFLKWQMYLRVLGVGVPAGLSSRIFLSGFAMSLTPGK